MGSIDKGTIPRVPAFFLWARDYIPSVYLPPRMPVTKASLQGFFAKSGNILVMTVIGWGIVPIYPIGSMAKLVDLPTVYLILMVNAGKSPSKWPFMAYQWGSRPNHQLTSLGAHPAYVVNLVIQQNLIPNTLQGGPRDQLSHEKNTRTLLSMGNPGCLMTGSLFRGLWHNPFITG